MITALVALPLAIVVGSALDLSRANTTRVHVANALDSALLATAAELAEGTDEAGAKALGQRLFAENLQTLGIEADCQPPNLQVDTANGSVTAAVDCDMPLTITSILGRDDMPIRPEATAEYGNDLIEVALMMDVSGSMRNQRLTDLKAAANSMIDTLIPVSDTGNIRISLAPYSTAVNAGSYGDVASGITDLYAHTVANLGADPNMLVAALTTSATSADTFDLIDTVGNNGLGTLRSTLLGSCTATPPVYDICSYGGASCNTITTGTPNRYPVWVCTDWDSDDGECESIVQISSGPTSSCISTTGSPSSIASDWQALDWTAASANYTNYDFSILGTTHEANVGAISCVTERFGTNAFTDVSPISYPVGAEASSCPNAPIEPLTHNTTILKDAIDSLEADGWTAGHLGIAWSWYTLSPSWNAVWPFNRRTQEGGMLNVRQYAVLMTDGSFNTYYASSQGDSAAQANSLCTAMKANDIEIYSVAFNAPSDAQAVLQACASSSTHYFAPTDGTELLAVYDAIAASLSQVRLTE